MLAQGFQDQDFLDVNEAFRVNFEAGADNNLEAFFQVAEGYYLYRGKISFDSSGGPTLSKIDIPEGERKTDEYFGEVMVLNQDFSVPVALGNFDGSLDPLVVDVTYQGCAEDGICYAPVVTCPNLRHRGGGPPT